VRIPMSELMLLGASIRSGRVRAAARPVECQDLFVDSGYLSRGRAELTPSLIRLLKGPLADGGTLSGYSRRVAYTVRGDHEEHRSPVRAQDEQY